MSATRREKRAAVNAVELPARKAEREAAKGKVQMKAPVPTKEPSPRPYREPEHTPKAKRIPRTASERDGQNLLSKIEAKGGRDIIVMMRDSALAPKELAENLIMNETIVISSLNTYGSGKDQLKRLMAAIEQAPVYLKDGAEQPVTKGVKKQQRQDKAREEQEKLAKAKHKPKTRVHVIPTIEEVIPRRDDQEIMFEELKAYLGLNTELRDRFFAVYSDQKAAGVLMVGVGSRFDAKMQTLLAEPANYQNLLAKAGSAIRAEVRKYDTSDAEATGPAPTIQESLEASTRRRQQETMDRFRATNDTKAEVAQDDANEPVDQDKQERDKIQQEKLAKYLEPTAQAS